MSFLSSVDKSLLRFCLEHSDGPKEGTPSTLGNRPKEDYEWLKEALKSVETDAQRMKRCAETLRREDGSVEEKKNALMEIQFLVEDIDNANDLHKVDGLVPVVEHMSHPSATVRVWSAWVLSTVVQNNPIAQQEALRHDALPKAISLLASSSSEQQDQQGNAESEVEKEQQEQEDEVQLKMKALSLISALVRHNPIAMRQFVEESNGISLLADIIRVYARKDAASFYDGDETETKTEDKEDEEQTKETKKERKIASIRQQHGLYTRTVFFLKHLAAAEEMRQETQQRAKELGVVAAMTSLLQRHIALVLKEEEEERNGEQQKRKEEDKDQEAEEDEFIWLEIREKTAAALVELLRGHPPAISECTASQLPKSCLLRLKAIRSMTEEHQDKFQQEMDELKELYRVLITPSASSSSSSSVSSSSPPQQQSGPTIRQVAHQQLQQQQQQQQPPLLLQPTRP
ncbi:nucleotide exchange factor sil1 [Balamuthia mandrillaris]